MACALPNKDAPRQSVDGTDEQDCTTLPECFDKIFKMHQYFDKTDDSSSSDIFQGKLRQAIENTQRAIRMVNDLDLFSRNEDIEEVATNEVKYMLLSAYLGYFTGLNTHMSRADAVVKSKMCYTDYLKLLKTYGIIEYDIRLSEGEDGDDDIENMVPSNRIRGSDVSVMSAQRNNKIQRFREKKEMERRIAELQPQVEREHVDEEVKREFYLTQIRHWANQAIDEVDSCNLELQMLKHRQEMAASAGGNHSNNKSQTGKPKPFRPFILTRTNLQKQVFGLGYPAIPTMTVDEFYQQKIQEGHLSESVQGHSMQNWAADPDRDALEREREDAEREDKEQREDEETLQRARAMDEWKDDHRRGDGNRYNKG